MLPMNRTKIVATVGPATDSAAAVERLVLAGVDVFRMNFSHGTLEEHATVFQRVREACQRHDIPAATMADLCGPKVRVDPVQGDAVTVSPGGFIDIVAEEVLGTSERISTNRPKLVDEVEVGHRVLIDDGAIALRVESKESGRLRCKCEVGGVIRTRKGVNLPDSDLRVAALTEADRDHAAWARENGVDFVALSFVRTAADIAELQALLGGETRRQHIVAKIETPQAVRNIEEIIRAADVVLVARGDLGVEVDLARVPLIQKDITLRCRSAGKPVIIATQMLQSMVNQPTATRAEVSDVANAVMDGADAVMLSAETSIGRYPFEAVTLMNRIADQAGSFVGLEENTLDGAGDSVGFAETSAVVRAAALLARETRARVVAVWTQSGNAVRLLSKCRLPCTVVGVSAEDAVLRRMAVYFGAVPLRMQALGDVVASMTELDETLVRRGVAERGDLAVVVAGSNVRRLGLSNAVYVRRIGEPAGA